MTPHIVGLVVTLALGLLVALLAADAQPPKKVPRIGYLGPGPTSPSGGIDALRDKPRHSFVYSSVE